MIDARTPAIFFGHGNPMNALEHNRYTEAWQGFGHTITPPRAILVISAHWYINATAVTAMATPRTIHDFYGFPDELFAVEYPAPGAPDIAAEVVEVAQPSWVGLDHDSWGIDHGTWSVLVHAFPEATIPVLQLSIDATASFDDHVELGVRLAPLRERGILIAGSGNVVHNLGRMDWHAPDAALPWAVRFDDAARELMTTAPADLPKLVEHPDFALAVPTPDHFIPLLHIAGLAAAAEAPANVLIDGYAYGSLSMTCFTVGTVDPLPGTAAPAGDEVAGAPSVPPLASNM